MESWQKFSSIIWYAAWSFSGRNVIVLSRNRRIFVSTLLTIGIPIFTIILEPPLLQQASFVHFWMTSCLAGDHYIFRILFSWLCNNWPLFNSSWNNQVEASVTIAYNASHQQFMIINIARLFTVWGFYVLLFIYICVFMLHVLYTHLYKDLWIFYNFFLVELKVKNVFVFRSVCSYSES